MSADRETDRKSQFIYSEKNMEKLPINPQPEKYSYLSNTRVRKEKGVTSNSTDEIDTAEKERRLKIKSLFAELHVMLPHVPPQVDKVTVVDETMNYIKILEQTLKNLEKKKLQRLHSNVVGNPPAISREAFIAEHVASSSSTSSPHNNNQNPEVKFQTWTSPNVAVNICGHEAQLSVCSNKNNRCLFTNICCVLDKYKIDVLSAHISYDNNGRFYMFQAQVNKDLNQPAVALSAEEIFKQAAAEIIQCVS